VFLRLESDRDAARLWLDPDAGVARRLRFTDEDHREAWGITLDFDGDGHLIGLEFAEPERQVPARLLADGEGARATFDPEVGAAYLYLQEIDSDGVAETLSFGEWGINLDFAGVGRLVGIEFEDAEVAPAALLSQAELLGGG
jgi:uncharacterized protein YuzE